MKTITFISLWLILASCIASAQTSKTTIKFITIDNKVTRDPFKIILSSENFTVDVPIVNNSFELPDGIDNKIGVRLLIDKFDLNFGMFDMDYFGQGWTVAIDRRPFSTEGLTKKERRDLKLVYVITFDSGGQAVYKVSKARTK